MTNKHCDACGDPIFRHDGREFCPTCHTQWDQQGGARDGGPDERAERADVPGGGAGPTDEAVPESPSAPATPPADPTDAAREAVADPVAEPDRSADDGEAPAGGRDSEGATSDPRRTDRRGDDGDLAAARASLGRSLASLARRAEAADDLSQKRTYLAAAREAAEALDAAERVGR